MGKKRYSEEFRKQAIDLVVEGYKMSAEEQL